MRTATRMMGDMRDLGIFEMAEDSSRYIRPLSGSPSFLDSCSYCFVSSFAAVSFIFLQLNVPLPKLGIDTSYLTSLSLYIPTATL